MIKNHYRWCDYNFENFTFKFMSQTSGKIRFVMLK